MSALRVETSESGRCHEFTPERGPSILVVDSDHYLSVNVLNAMAKLRRCLGGKNFHQPTRQGRIEAVRRAYKSATVHAALDWLEANPRGCTMALVAGGAQ